MKNIIYLTMPGVWRRVWLGALLVLTLLPIPVCFSETEIHRQDANGNVAVEIYRTAREQEMADHQYIKPDGSAMYYLDSETGRPTTKEHYEEDFQKQAQKVMDANNGILDSAREEQRAGKMTQEEYLEYHSKIKLANGNLQTWVSSVRESQKDNRLAPDSASTPKRQIKIIERKVLVSG